MTLGQRIQVSRRQHGLSQEKLGEQLGVSRQAVSRWEMDGAVPEVDKLVAMARLFGLSLDQLMGNAPPEGEQPSVSEQRPRLRAHWPSTALMVLLAAALVASLALNAYFYTRILSILDPPVPPDCPIQTVRYAFRPDYEDKTVDLAVSLEDPQALLRGWDVSWTIRSIYGKEPLFEQDGPLELHRNTGELSWRDIPFGYHGRISVGLLYTKDELTGYQHLLMAEPTGQGIDWIVTTNGGTALTEAPALLPE